MISAADLPECGDLKSQEILGPLIVRGSLSLWAGVAGLGKSTFCYGTAAALADGLPFCDMGKPGVKLNVLLCDLETPGALRRRKLERVTGGSRPRNLHFWKPEEPFGVSELERVIRTLSIDVVVIDTLGIAIPVRSEDDNAEANRQMGPLKAICHRTGAAIVAIHHMGKKELGTAEGTSEAYEMRGATARPCAADIVVTMRNHQGAPGVIRIRLAKSRFADCETWFIKKAGNDQFEVSDAQDSVGTKHARAMACAQEFVRTAGAAGAGNKDIVAHIEGTAGISESTARRALEDCVELGTISKPTRGQYVHPEFLLGNVHQAPPPRAEQNEQTRTGLWINYDEIEDEVDDTALPSDLPDRRAASSGVTTVSTLTAPDTPTDTTS